jgi:hypothetical protein
MLVRAACEVVRERDFRLVADRILDLSATGALLGPADPVLTGERLILSFPGVSGAWIDAETVVARVSHGRRRGEHTRTLGVSFERLDAPARAALLKVLARAIPAPPRSRRERRLQPR